MQRFSSVDLEEFLQLDLLGLQQKFYSLLKLKSPGYRLYNHF